MVVQHMQPDLQELCVHACILWKDSVYSVSGRQKYIVSLAFHPSVVLFSTDAVSLCVEAE